MTGVGAEPAVAALVEDAGPPPAVHSGHRTRSALARAGWFVASVVVVCALWEAYKAVGSPDGGSVFGVRVLPRADDASMPHVWQVLERFGRPESAAEDSDPVAVAVFDAAWFTFRVAMVGLLLGGLIGFGLGPHSRHDGSPER